MDRTIAYTIVQLNKWGAVIVIHDKIYKEKTYFCAREL